MIRLYRFAYSTNVERVALALAYKGLEVESVWVDPDDRSEVERVSGQRLVPAELGQPEPDRERISALGAQMRGWLDQFEALLDGRDYLFGDELTAADLAAFPFVKYALLWEEGDDELFHQILRDYQREPGPRVEAWIRRIDALPRA